MVVGTIPRYLPMLVSIIVRQSMAESIRQIGSGLVHFAGQQPLIQEELFYSSDI